MGPKEACLTVFIVIGRYQTDPRNQTSFEKKEELLTIKLCLLSTNVGIEGSSLASKHFL